MIETGIDIVEIPRIETLITRHGDAFLTKIFHPDEISYCESRGQKYEHYAARFAAKEACRKALLSHLTFTPSWTDTYIVSDKTGKPFLKVSKKIQDDLSIHHLSVSLSHTKNLAIAFVLIDIGETR
ncbi:MAG: holo-ACP synthase [Candidatus Marinimicrobia bacterium]|nr:holo-ACP synthase [Candidatus Neomarinimicrobiota bacterium]MDD5582426.1 holo-ACP synthase [Candidatus Neomarinimicrobiota bacterium]